MSIALTFALLSMLCAGAVDIVYKLYGREPRGLGFFLVVTGLIWAILHGLRMAWLGESLHFDQATLLFGSLAGLAVTLSNLLLLLALRMLEVSQGSTIYRLNTIGVVILSALFLAEPLGLAKGLGIACGIAAVLLLYRPIGQPTEHTSQDLRIGLLVAIAASCLRAVYGVLSKAGISAGGDPSTMILIAALCWILGGLLYGLLRDGRQPLTRAKLGYASLGGLVVFLTVTTLIAAIERGDVSIVVPIANLSFVVALGYSVCTGMERFSARKGLVLVLAVVAIILLSQAA